MAEIAHVFSPRYEWLLLLTSLLRESHDALLLAIGATKPRDLSIEGRSLSGKLLCLCSRQNESVDLVHHLSFVPSGCNKH